MDYITLALLGIPNKGEQNQKWLPPPCLLKRGRKCYVTPAFSGVPNAKRGEQHQKRCPTKGNKIRGDCRIPAFSGAGRRVDGLHHTCVLGDPQRRGTKSKVAAASLPSQGPKRGWMWYITLAFLGIPKKRGTQSEVAVSSMPSRGPKRGQKCYVTPVFSGGPNAKRGEQHQKWCPKKRNKIRKGCCIPAF